jgi:hypothetical protein
MRSRIGLGHAATTLLLLAGCSSEPGSSPPKTAESASAARAANSEQQTVAPEAEPDLARDLALSFLESPQATLTRYRGKTLLLKGKVIDYGTAAGRMPYLILEGATASKLDGTTIQCVHAEARPWKRAGPGQTVTLRGTWPDYCDSPAFNECRIVAVEGDPPPRLTAVDLSRQHDADFEASKELYRDKHLCVTGVIAIVDFDDKIQTAKVTLAGADRPVECFFPAFDGSPLKTAAAGDTITVLGEYDGFLKGEQDPVSLIYCSVVEGPERP